MTNEQVKADIAANLPDNTSGLITPAKLRTELGTMVDYSDTSSAAAVAGLKLFTELPIGEVGDSITCRDDYDSSHLDMRGIFAFAAPILQCARIVPRPDGELVFAHSGYTTAQVIAAGYHTQAAASDAQVVSVLIGTNDVSLDDSAATIFARIRLIVETITAANKWVVLWTVLPRGSLITTEPNQLRLLALNDLIRAYARTAPLVRLCDAWGLFVAPLTGYATQTGKYIEAAGSELHPNGYGYAQLGSLFASTVRTIPGCPSGFWDGPTGPAGTGMVISHNPFGSGSAGVLPESWYDGAIDDGSATYAKVSRTDGVAGEWTEITVTGSAPDGVYVYVFNNTDVVAGDEIYGVLELEELSSGFGGRQVYLTISDGITLAATRIADYGVETVAYRPAMPGVQVLRTPKITVAEGATLLTARLFLVGSCKVRVGRFAIMKA